MSILFAASEVGSVRSIVPIIHECIVRNIDFKIVRLGYFLQYEESLGKFFINIDNDSKDIKEKLLESHFSNLIFSVNIFDTLPLKIARQAKELGIVTLHVIDYWNKYKYRMTLDEKKSFEPFKYFVPDELAFKGALEDGISEHILEVSGHPAFVDIVNQFHGLKKSRRRELMDLFVKIDNRDLLLFISEPVEQDKQKEERGYSEEIVLKYLVNTLSRKNFKERYYVAVMPHPRENKNHLENIWHEIGGDDFGHVEKELTSFELLPFAKGVIGMTSTFLYQSWLFRLPILSIRPNDLSARSNHLFIREGIVSIDHEDNILLRIEHWLLALTNLEVYPDHREDTFQHKDSVNKILSFIKN